MKNEIKLLKFDKPVLGEQGFVYSELHSTDTGGLVGVGPQLLTIDTFCRLFVTNNHRRELFAKFKQWLTQLNQAKVNILSVWFGGSFVESKDTPGDIDILLIFQWSKDVQEIPDCLNPALVKSKYPIDLYLLDLEKNPADVIHAVSLFTMYFSHPSDCKDKQDQPFVRKAVISVLGNELSKLL